MAFNLLQTLLSFEKALYLSTYVYDKHFVISMPYIEVAQRNLLLWHVQNCDMIW